MYFNFTFASHAYQQAQTTKQNLNVIYIFNDVVPSMKLNLLSLNLLIRRCVSSVLANFPSSMAAAVRGGKPIVQTNKGHRGHMHFHKSFARGVGEASSTLVCLVWIYTKAFSIKSHRSESIIKGDRLD